MGTLRRLTTQTTPDLPKHFPRCFAFPHCSSISCGLHKPESFLLLPPPCISTTTLFQWRWRLLVHYVRRNWVCLRRARRTQRRWSPPPPPLPPPLPCISTTT